MSRFGIDALVEDVGTEVLSQELIPSAYHSCDEEGEFDVHCSSGEHPLPEDRVT